MCFMWPPLTINRETADRAAEWGRKQANLATNNVNKTFQHDSSVNNATWVTSDRFSSAVVGCLTLKTAAHMIPRLFCFCFNRVTLRSRKSHTVHWIIPPRHQTLDSSNVFWFWNYWQNKNVKASRWTMQASFSLYFFFIFLLALYEHIIMTPELL